LSLKIVRFAQVKDMYWQACLVVLIVAVFNPSTIGHFVWESIPSLRNLMEVLIAGDKAFQSSRLDLPSCTFLVSCSLLHVLLKIVEKARDFGGHIKTQVCGRH